MFNRNYATQPKFLTWQLRDVHQPVYTGQTQSNKGIDRPVFQISVFAQSMVDAFNLSNTILQSLHGYSGQFGQKKFCSVLTETDTAMHGGKSGWREIGGH